MSIKVLGTGATLRHGADLSAWETEGGTVAPDAGTPAAVPTPTPVSEPNQVNPGEVPNE